MAWLGLIVKVSLVRAIQALWCQIEIDVKVKVPPLYRQTIQTWVTVGVKVKA
jgi:hypothetical protein